MICWYTTVDPLKSPGAKHQPRNSTLASQYKGIQYGECGEDHPVGEPAGVVLLVGALERPDAAVGRVAEAHQAADERPEGAEQQHQHHHRDGSIFPERLVLLLRVEIHILLANDVRDELPEEGLDGGQALPGGGFGGHVGGV